MSSLIAALGANWRHLRGALLRLLAECRRQESVALLLVTLILVTRQALVRGHATVILEPLWTSLGHAHPLLAHALLRRQLVAFALQLLVPLLVISVIHRQRWRDFGMGLGDVRFWLPVAALVLLVQLTVVGGYLAHDPVYAARYPTLPAARAGGTPFLIWESSRLLYFCSWELLFRGYLLFALRPRIGELACVVQTVPFTLMHIVSGKPTSEIYFTIVSGLLSGAFALAARSAWPLVLLHSAGAIALDAFIVFH